MVTITMQENEYLEYEEFRRTNKIKNNNKTKCLHDFCPHCHGTGIMKDGTKCNNHYVICKCNKCLGL